MPSRIIIRYAATRDSDRLISDGLFTGAASNGEGWEKRIALWLSEQNAGRRIVLVAEDETGLLGTIQLVFRFPPGIEDREAANGYDVAMIESLRIRPSAAKGLSQQLLTHVQSLARKKNIKTITFCIPMSQQRAVAQVKAWGFAEFRIMPEANKMLAFFRKSVD